MACKFSVCEVSYSCIYYIHKYSSFKTLKIPSFGLYGSFGKESTENQNRSKK